MQVPPAASAAPRTRLQTAKQLFLPKRLRDHFVMHSQTHNPRMGEEFLDPACPRGFRNGHQPNDWRVLDASWTPHQHQKWSLQWFPRRNRIGVYAVAPVTTQPSILRRTQTVHTPLFPASDAVRTGSDFPPGSDSVVTTTGSDSSAASASYDRISPSESSAIRVSEPTKSKFRQCKWRNTPNRHAHLKRTTNRLTCDNRATNNVLRRSEHPVGTQQSCTDTKSSPAPSKP